MEKAGKCHRAPCHPFSCSKELLKACNAFQKLLNRVGKARLVPLKSKRLHKALHIALGLRDQERLFVSSKPAAAATAAATAAAATSAACATPAHIAYVRMHACMYIPLLRCYIPRYCLHMYIQPFRLSALMWRHAWTHLRHHAGRGAAHPWWRSQPDTNNSGAAATPVRCRYSQRCGAK